ncbi:ubiquitin protein ligase 5 [Wolffia australiana]
MFVVESPGFAAALKCLRRKLQRDSGFPSKRKLDEILSINPEQDKFSFSHRMRSLRKKCFKSTSGLHDDLSGVLQFFVRVSSRTIVIRALPEDTVKLVQDQLNAKTRIPQSEQRLVFECRLLCPDFTVAESGIKNNSSIQLIGRLKSTPLPGAWMVANELVSATRSYFPRKLVSTDCSYIEYLVNIFLEMIPNDDVHSAWRYLDVFVFSGASAALVSLYASSKVHSSAKVHAENAIKIFLRLDSELWPSHLFRQSLTVVLEFYKLLSAAVSRSDRLLLSCRRAISSLLESTATLEYVHCNDKRWHLRVLEEILPYVRHSSGVLALNLSQWVSSNFSHDNFICASVLIEDFSSFLSPLRAGIGRPCLSLPCTCEQAGIKLSENGFRWLHIIFVELLDTMGRCLGQVEEKMLRDDKWAGSTILLTLLTTINDLTEIFPQGENVFHALLAKHSRAVNALIRKAKHSHGLWWIRKHRDVTNFESRRHLALLMFPDELQDFEEMHEMLIDRSSILTESFEYIYNADALSLQGGLFVEFKNEEATGPGVLREWFCLLCREIFNDANVLFRSCPLDRRRFYPNPASDVEPLYLRYFMFCGRLIALALMHGIQIGIVLDRTFYLQLAGRPISLDDVQDADPFLHSSCKKILEMDAELLDSDVLGLTFVREIERLGVRRTVELCYGGKDKSVNSGNRQRYVDLMIRHCFVTSTSAQVKSFLTGFSDILCDPLSHKLFFGSLDPEDLDRMLGGDDGSVSVKDWKKHTDYNGYKASDNQICWFWKVVECMSKDQRRSLLFFWTSVKFLPLEGFSGLGSKLSICRSSKSVDHLPVSQTCFYQLSLPPYPSHATMKKRLLFVTQAHVNSGFGEP